jgi:hypothetical protein
MAFEILDFAFVLLGGGKGFESAEVAAFAGLGVFLAGVETVFAGGEFADHCAVLHLRLEDCRRAR